MFVWIVSRFLIRPPILLNSNNKNQIRGDRLDLAMHRILFDMLDSMHTELISEEAATRRLQASDILPTLQRIQIARILFARDQHLSADQVLDKVNATGGRVSKATVYNTLGLFAKKGVIREVIVDPTRVFYDTNISRHHHFYNIDTGELTDIDAELISLENYPELPAGTVAEGVDIIIRIRCDTNSH